MIPDELARLLRAMVHLDASVLTVVRSTACVVAAAALVGLVSRAQDRRWVWVVGLISMGTVFAVGIASAWPRTAMGTPGWIGAVWLGGFLATAGRAALGLVMLSRLRRVARPVDDAARNRVIADACRSAEVRQPVDIRWSDRVPTPITFGWLRPTVLLPSQGADWSDERLAIVLLHELVHVRRRDWLLHLGERVIAAVYWFHPGVRWCAHRHHVETERACDEAVIASGIQPLAYASHLVALAAVHPSRGFSAASAFVPWDAAILEERVSGIIAERGRRPARRWSRVAAVLLVGCAAAGSIAATTPASVCPVTGRPLPPSR